MRAKRNNCTSSLWDYISHLQLPLKHIKNLSPRKYVKNQQRYKFLILAKPGTCGYWYVKFSKCTKFESPVLWKIALGMLKIKMWRHVIGSLCTHTFLMGINKKKCDWKIGKNYKQIDWTELENDISEIQVNPVSGNSGREQNVDRWSHKPHHTKTQ